MQQITDEILFDLQIALVSVHHPRQDVHVGDHFALAIVDDFALGIAIGQAVNLRQRPPFGHFLAGEIEFLAPDPINGRGSLQRFGRQDRRVRADKTDFRAGLLLP